MDIENDLVARISATDRIIHRLLTRSRQLSRWRLLLFASVSIFSIVGGYVEGQRMGWTIFILGMLPFIAMVMIHRSIDTALHRWTTWKKILIEDMARLRLDWEAIPLSDVPEPEPTHPYALDLNVSGKYSLSHLIDVSISAGGSQRLGHWLLEPDLSIDRILDRQQTIRELSSQPYLIRKLRWIGALASASKNKRWDTDVINRWLQAAPAVPLDRLMVILFTLSAMNAVGFLLWLVGAIPGWWILSFIAYIIIYGLNGGALMHTSSESSQLYESMGRFRELFAFLIKKVKPKTPTLYALTDVYRSEERNPLNSLKRLRRIAFYSGVTRNDVFFILLNSLLPWNLLFTWLLEKEKSKLKQFLPVWLDRWYSLEAACSLAGVATLNTDTSWPMPDKNVIWEAMQTSHPLIPNQSRVYNDHRFDDIGKLGLLTGSNMAGKSTFLRTVGLNTVLANAGAPVIATSMRWRPARVFTSMKITDSVTEGYSYFFAEVKRLKALYDATLHHNEGPVLYLIDEIFKGTNTKERLIGSRAYITSLTEGYGFGLVATHDLELIKLSQETDRISNLHFEENFVAGQMHFSYKLMKGPCTSTNALHIMRQAGLKLD
jgi:hypothetical protein